MQDEVSECNFFIPSCIDSISSGLLEDEYQVALV